MNPDVIDDKLNPLEPAEEVKPAPAEAPDGAAQEVPADPLAQLKSELSQAKAEAEQWKDRCLRKAAEYENYRKRSDRERSDAATSIKSEVLAEFLLVLDACERALISFSGATGKSASVQKYREGVELLYKQLGDTLTRLGVVALETKGKPFDPHFHEALAHQETMEYEDNTIIEELRRGYVFKERLLRPAQVVVASRPKPKKENEAQE